MAIFSRFMRLFKKKEKIYIHPVDNTGGSGVTGIPPVTSTSLVGSPDPENEPRARFPSQHQSQPTSDDPTPHSIITPTDEEPTSKRKLKCIDTNVLNSNFARTAFPSTEERKTLAPELLGRLPSGSQPAENPTPVPFSLPTPTDEEPTTQRDLKRLNTNQLDVLNNVFARTTFPSTEERHKLAKRLDVSPRSIQIWFQNKRQIMRQGNHQSSNTNEAAPDDSINLGSAALFLSGVTDPPDTSVLVGSLGPVSQSWSHQSHLMDNSFAPTLTTPTTEASNRLDASQLKVLNETYARNAFPSTEERNILAKQLNISPRSVQIWFQNKRQSMRQGNNAMSSGGASCDLSSSQGV